MGGVKKDIGRILRELCERKGIEIIEAELCPDHIHMFAEMVNGSLEGELDDELGYDRYNVEYKETVKSRNGFGHKTLQTS